jgi:hypothetical protein
MPTKIFPDFCPTLSEQKSGIFLVGILGETMTGPHKIILNLTDLYGVLTIFNNKGKCLFRDFLNTNPLNYN